MRRGIKEPPNHTPYLLVQTSQHFWLVQYDDVYQHFTYVAHTIILSSLSGLVLPELSLPCGLLFQPLG